MPLSSTLPPGFKNLSFFFQAEDGIRDDLVTGVQTCALPIYLCRQLDQPQKLLPILYGQWINHTMRGDMDRAQQLGGEIRQLGGDGGDRFADLMGRWSGGFTSLHLGDFVDARVHFEDGIALFDPIQRRQYLQLTPIDALVFLSTQLSLAQACLGFLDRARSRRDFGTAEARRLGHAHTLAAALYFV